MAKLVIIRNLESDLVLDTTMFGRVCTAIYDTNRPSQRWYMTAAGDGSYTFRNRASGQVLAVLQPQDVHTIAPSNRKDEYWLINNDQTIQNKAKRLVLDIYEGSLQPGNKLILFPKHGGKNQRFAVTTV